MCFRITSVYPKRRDHCRFFFLNAVSLLLPHYNVAFCVIACLVLSPLLLGANCTGEFLPSPSTSLSEELKKRLRFHPVMMPLTSQEWSQVFFSPWDMQWEILSLYLFILPLLFYIVNIRFILFIIVLGGVHCVLYKDSYNVSNISYLNSPPPPLSFIPPSLISGTTSTSIIFAFTYYCFLNIFSVTS
jgi:hypothetical protein